MSSRTAGVGAACSPAAGRAAPVGTVVGSAARNERAEARLPWVSAYGKLAEPGIVGGHGHPG
jgi:hypothetical protein